MIGEASGSLQIKSPGNAQIESRGSVRIKSRGSVHINLAGSVNSSSLGIPAPSIPARLLLAAVRVYQTFFSALMPSACKFYPTCSHYAAEAVRLHGARRGSWLALRRLGRCHPFTAGGVDLVPDSLPESSARAANSIDEHVNKGVHS